MVEINKSPQVFGGNQSRPTAGHKTNIYFERKLRDVFYEAADNAEGTIYGEQEWNYYVALLLKMRLVSIRDAERLETVKPSFPLTFETFVNTV